MGTMSTTWTETRTIYKIGVTTNRRDLGVQIDPDLKFNQHVETVTSKQDVMHDMTSVHVQGRRHHQEAIH